MDPLKETGLMKIQPLGLDGVQRRIREIESKMSAVFGDVLASSVGTERYGLAAFPARTVWNENAMSGNPLAMGSAIDVLSALGNAPLNPLDLIPSNLGVGLAELQSLADKTAGEFGLDAALFRSLINVESGWNPNSVSPKGAQGLTQLMPDVARELGVIDPFDPAQNLRGGAKYLKQMLDRFGSIELAIAAYKAGPGAVARYNGVPPFADMQSIVRRIIAEAKS